MKIYGSVTSPYVRKVRILALEKGIACEFITADAWGADSPIPKLNPLGKVPVFERDDGKILFDSPLICEYLDGLKSPALIPVSGEPRWQALLVHALAQGMLDATVARLLESRRPDPQKSTDAIARQEQKIAQSLAYASGLIAGRQYLVGERFGYADLCLAVALDYVDFRYAHPWHDKHAALGRWLATINDRPSFRETMAPGMERRT